MDLSQKQLERMHEEGVISEKEFTEKSKSINEHKEEFVPPVTEEPAKEEINKKSDFNFLIAILIVIILFVGVFSFAYFMGKPKIVTFDDLHDQAIAGDLKEDEGYVYNGYSFIIFDNQKMKGRFRPLMGTLGTKEGFYTESVDEFINKKICTHKNVESHFIKDYIHGLLSQHNVS